MNLLMKWTLNLTVLSAIGISSSWGTVPEGYPSTILENEEQVSALFKTMEDGFKKKRPLRLQFGSECTQRAETWTYEMDRTKNVKSQKVFVFYTLEYFRYYKKIHGESFNWWFHVSPYVLSKGSDGSVQERVLDREFADAPQSMKEWTDLFIESGEKCIENVPYASFEGDVTGEGASYNQNAHCYLVRSPMYDMFPADADARERGTLTRMEWDMGQVQYGAKALPRHERKNFLKRVGL